MTHDESPDREVGRDPFSGVQIRIGVIGSALTFFGPAQLYLGVLALILLAWTLRVRARALAQACPFPALRPRLERAQRP